MLRGMSTVSYFADDVSAAQSWYAEVLGLDAYFVRDHEGRTAYAEFRIGDHQDELGIVDRRFASGHPADTEPGTESGTAPGAIVYWHVDDLRGSFERLLSLGARVHQPPIDRGEGFVTATVVDPFGNILGIMYNPHYLAMLSA